MDLEEWELLPDDGYLEINDDRGKKIFSRKYGTDPKSVFKMNYFICPSQRSEQITESPGNSRLPKQLVPVPFQLNPTIARVPDHDVVKEITQVPIEIRITRAMISEHTKSPNIGAVEADQDPVSQVFFKPKKETEFVDMKMDSPRSSSRGIVPQIDACLFQFDDKGEASEIKHCSPKMEVEKEIVTKKTSLDSVTIKEVSWEENDGGLNIWKWSLTGIGAICSFGVAAASICIIFFGTQQRNKQHHRQQSQKLLDFQNYTDNKRIKQVVHHTTKLNEAISAVRGVPMARAHITFGGYYDHL